MPAMNALAESLRHELQGLETVLHRLTTLRLTLATGTHRSIDAAATELDEALVALAAAETACVDLLRSQGYAGVADAIAASDEPLRSDLMLTRTRLARAHREVLGAARAASHTASRPASHAPGQGQIAHPDPSGWPVGAMWHSYERGGRSTV